MKPLLLLFAIAGLLSGCTKSSNSIVGTWNVMSSTSENRSVSPTGRLIDTAWSLLSSHETLTFLENGEAMVRIDSSKIEGHGTYEIKGDTMYLISSSHDTLRCVYSIPSSARMNLTVLEGDGSQDNYELQRASP